MATVKTPRRGRRVAFVVPLLVSLVFLPGGPARANPDPHGADAAKPETHRVTLVTGDTVDFTDAGAGHRAVSIDAAPRPDRAPVVFETVGGRDDFYVIPSDAEPFLATGVLDRALFNVAGLVRDGLTGTVPVIVSYTGR